MHDASSKAYVYNLDGSLEHQIELPGIGTISGFSGQKESNTAFYSFTSFVYPSMAFKYDIKNNKTEVFRKSGIDIDINQFETNFWIFGPRGDESPLEKTQFPRIYIRNNRQLL